MKTLLFATNNQHKIDEVRSIPHLQYSITGLREAGIDIDIPEPFDTLEENAAEKSGVVFNLTKQDCFSEDTGLEVEILNGEPGVKSARYAGEGKSFEKNIEKLLTKLEGCENRNAQFRTILSLVLNGAEYKFEGICKGIILAYTRGEEGFGYDPLFVPMGSDRTFAEMNMAEKNRYSHRKKAMDKMVDFLNNVQ